MTFKRTGRTYSVLVSIHAQDRKGQYLKYFRTAAQMINIKIQDDWILYFLRRNELLFKNYCIVCTLTNNGI